MAMLYYLFLVECSSLPVFEAEHSSNQAISIEHGFIKSRNNVHRKELEVYLSINHNIVSSTIFYEADNEAYPTSTNNGVISISFAMVPTEKIDFPNPFSNSIHQNDIFVACCLDGACFTQLEENCVQAGGTVHSSLLCFPNPCFTMTHINPSSSPEVITCCHPKGACTISHQEDCIRSGTMHLDANNCNPNPCTQFTPTASPTKGNHESPIRAPVHSYSPNFLSTYKPTKVISHKEQWQQPQNQCCKYEDQYSPLADSIWACHQDLFTYQQHKQKSCEFSE